MLPGLRHLSLSTERAYPGWIRRFILFHNKKHPKEMAEKEIREYISDLAVNAKISAFPQKSFSFGLRRPMCGGGFAPPSG
jgi:hypothetical protein